MLVRWNIRWNKIDSRKVAALACRPRQRQVPAMDGVEGAAEEANIHARLVSSFATRLASLPWFEFHLTYEGHCPIVHCLSGPHINAQELNAAANLE